MSTRHVRFIPKSGNAQASASMSVMCQKGRRSRRVALTSSYVNLASTRAVSPSQASPAKGKVSRRASCRAGVRAVCSRRRARRSLVLTVGRSNLQCVSGFLDAQPFDLAQHEDNSERLR